MEGGEEVIDSIKRIISAGIPVMGHLGLMPQSINKYGTYAVRAKEEEEAIPTRPFFQNTYSINFSYHS